MLTTWARVSAVLALALAGTAAADGAPYRVYVDRADDGLVRPAALALAKHRGGEVTDFVPEDLPGLLVELRKDPPRYAVFALAPEKIDVDLVHGLLATLAQVDPDPFVDVEHAFLTGRDAASALRFVERIVRADARERGARAGLFGSWEGGVVPDSRTMTSLAALGFDADVAFIRASDAEDARKRAARAALERLAGRDLLMFFSHGTPTEMSLCFSARDLRAWGVDLAGAVLVNCACWNGAPGRWYDPRPTGGVDRGLVGREDSVALALLDSNITAYFAGIDPWHGPLANQVTLLLADDGLTCGAAAKRMHDRLALAFHPAPIRYAPAATTKAEGEGRANRLANGAGMIFYGDPAHAPFARRARHLLSAEATFPLTGPARIAIALEPLVRGAIGADFMLPQARLMDYYSVATADVVKELGLELYRVVDLPAGVRAPTALRVVRARSGARDLAMGAVQTVVEDTLDGQRLHVRVPFVARMFGDGTLSQLATEGALVELAGE